MNERKLMKLLRNNPDLGIVDTTPAAPRPIVLRPAGMSQPAAQFLYFWQLLGGEPLEQEYRFHPRRRWRFDFALPARKIAIEINGGVWVKGRHTRGRGYLNDREKINAATALGWRVFEFGTGQVTLENVQAIVELCH